MGRDAAGQGGVEQRALASRKDLPESRLNAAGAGVRPRLLQRAEGQRDDQDPGPDGVAARRFRQAFAQQYRIDEDQQLHRREVGRLPC